MFALPEYFLKEGTWSSQDNFVRLYLLTILTCQGHIGELLFVSQISKSRIYIFLKVIPLKAKFFRHGKQEIPSLITLTFLTILTTLITPIGLYHVNHISF